MGYEISKQATISIWSKEMVKGRENKGKTIRNSGKIGVVESLSVDPGDDHGGEKRKRGS